MAETQTFSYQPETTTETNLDQLTPCLLYTSDAADDP